MDVIWAELTSGIGDARRLTFVLVRLVTAVLLGAIIGFVRQRAGKPAGLRTHMLVMLGATVFVLTCMVEGLNPDGVSRVIQGIVTGIGFIGAGSILKLGEQQNVRGLTSAAGVWMTAAIGVAVGMGSLGVAVLATLCTLFVLSFAKRFERKVDAPAAPPVKTDSGGV